MKPFFLIAFTILSLATILLLGFAIQFFSSAPVWMQLNAWAREVAPVSSPLLAARMAPSQPLQQSFVALPTNTRQAPTLTPALPPTATALPAQPQQAQPTAARASAEPELEIEPESEPEPEPAPVEPTPEPIYQVAVEAPPEGNLLIPSLGIDQPLTPVQVRGPEWDITNLGDQVGWLETTGASPGSDRAMVLIGHITLPSPGGPGPFLKLNTLQPGSVVIYYTGQVTFVYQVTGQAIVNPESVESLYQSDGNKILLITCTNYNALERKYDRRLLVEAALVHVEIVEN